MNIVDKLRSIFKHKEKTVHAIAENTGIPKSTVHYHKKRISERVRQNDTDFWETERGRTFIIRLVIGTIYRLPT
jgi:hypothetical protein